MKRFGPLVLVLAVIIALGAVSRQIVGHGLAESTTQLEASARIRLLTAEVTREVLVQNEATELMLLDPGQIAEVSEAKIAAYDRQTVAMAELQRLATGSEVSSLITALGRIDEVLLKPLDERLLESLASGETDAAKALYLSEYLPERSAYSTLMARVAWVADRQAREGEARLAAQTEHTLTLLAVVFGAISVLVTGLFAVNLSRRAALDTNSRLTKLVEITRGLLKTSTVDELRSALRAELPEAALELTQVPTTTELDWARRPLVVPLQLGARPMGALTVTTTQPLASDERDFWSSLAMTVAQHLAGLEARAELEAGAERLRGSEAQTRAVLESLGEGLVVLDLTGASTPLASRSLLSWFGPLPAGTPIASYLLPEGPKRGGFELSLAQLCEDVFPFEVSAGQFPAVIEREGRVFSIGFSPITVDERLTRIILTLREVTEETRLRRETLESRDLLHFLERSREQPDEASDFLRETDAELARLTQLNSLEWKRALHTIKGTAGMFGLESFAGQVHRAETAADEREGPDAEWAAKLQGRWATFIAQVKVLRGANDQVISVPRASLEAIADALERHDELTHARQLRTLAAAPLKPRLETLRRLALKTARQLEKQVEVEVRCGDTVSVDPERFSPFLRSLVHVVRNAIDHGVEPIEARLAAQKSSTAHLCFEAQLVGSGRTGSLRVVIADDGRGIDFTRVAERAQQLGLPTATHAELVRALFHDGLSTRAEVTQLSGRGVGLAAVLAETEALGGAVDVEVHGGTRFLFTLPLFPTLRVVDAPVALGA